MKRYFSFQWHITDECDQRCRHCYIYSDNPGKEPASMGWPEIEKTFQNCLDFCDTFNRLPYFYITGGDPILHRDFWRLLEMLSEKDIPFTILGNPFHLDKEVCGRLRELGCRKYQVSIDGMRETHDFFRKPGSFDATLEKIKVINDSGMESAVMTTVSKANIDEVPEIIRTVAANGVGVYAFARFCPSFENSDPPISPQEYRDLLKECDGLFKAYNGDSKCQTYFSKKDHLWRLYEYEAGEFKIPDSAEAGMIYGGCNCGNCHLTILPNGDVYACRRVEGSRVGNALSERLADLWLNEMEAYREYSNFSKCSKCELLAWCRGCPAVANGYSGGDFYAGDPQCWKDLETAPEAL